MTDRRYFFSTRDLLMMAALAALGGVTSTYINALGNVVHAALGFPGATQWAAGLHVLWLVLAAGLTRRPGAGTITGILKGGVELLSGNTHGLIVVLVDIIAGLLVDLAFLPFRRKDNVLAYGLAGGLSSGSNVFVFQIFAALPAGILGYGALTILAVVAFASGALFGGLLCFVLVNALRRAGVVRDQPAPALDRRIYLGFLAVAVVLTAALTFYLRHALSGPPTVRVAGAVASPYDYPTQNGDIPMVTAEGTLRGITSSYNGVPVDELLARADPQPEATLLLVQASDGYAFFVGMAEIAENDGLLLAPKGSGAGTAYDLVGAQNSKAWVRDVTSLTVVGAATLEIEGALENALPFDPSDWQFQMDSARLDVGDGPRKYQGVPLGWVLQDMAPQPQANTVALYAAGDDQAATTLPLSQVLEDDDLRLFTVIGDAEVSFAVARMSGEVLLSRVGRIKVR